MARPRVLTDAERKERKGVYEKKRYEENKQLKQRVLLSEEEKIKRKNEYQKKRYEENKEVFNEQNKKWRLTPNGKKSETISSWKKRGLIHDNIDELYDNYLNTTECDVCKCAFDETNKRCMDHDHETNLFRQFLCLKCNFHDNWKKLN